MPEEAVLHAAQALADPSRLQLLEALSEGDATVSDLAARLAIVSVPLPSQQPAR